MHLRKWFSSLAGTGVVSIMGRKELSLRSISVIIILFVLSHGHALKAQSNGYQSHTINGDERWSGEIRLTGDVVVERGARLTIEAGTTILVSPHTDSHASGRDLTRIELIIEGVLICRGTSEEKIVFTSEADEPRMGDWFGIQINNPRQKSIIDYSIIEYGYDGLSIKHSDPQIRNSTIRYNYNSGLTIETQAAPLLVGNIISENGYAGIICRLGAAPVLKENMVTLHQVGMITFSLSQPNLGSLESDDQYNEGNNVFIDNSAYHIYNHASQPIKAENNNWGVQGLEVVKKLIFDKEDDPQYGLVDVEPLKTERRTTQQSLLISQSENAGSGGEDTLGTNPEDALQPDAREQQMSKQQDSLDALVRKLRFDRDVRSLQPERRETNLVGEDEGEITIDYDRVFLDAFLDEKKKIVSKKRPKIDDSERAMKTEGRVIVQVVVNRSGRVESAKVLRGLNPYMDRKALEAAEKFIFEPGTINNVPVRFKTSLFFEF